MVGRELEEMKKIASQYPAQALAVKCDLMQDLALIDLKTAVKDKFGGLDILINCAGVILAGDLESTKPQEFDLMMDTNMRTPFILMQIFMNDLKESKGCVVNVSSDKGSRAEPGLISYCMSKAGLDMLTKGAAVELATFGVRVNGVAPSFVDTNLYRAAGLSESEYDALKIRAASNIPMNRISTASQVAKAIIFITSEQ